MSLATISNIYTYKILTYRIHYSPWEPVLSQPQCERIETLHV